MTDTPDHLAKRQNALPEADRGELNARLEAVAQSFGPDWLARNGENPVQVLWSRRDSQSTNELLLLGDAIVNLSGADPAWVAQEVDFVKTDDPGTRAGHLFELLGLNLFHAPGQRVIPAPANNPGYDGNVLLADGSSLMLSIKNHGISSKEINFRANAEEAKDAFLAACESQRRPASLTIAAPQYPAEVDWARLRRDIGSLVALAPTNENFWQGRIQNIPPEFYPLSPHHLSYLFQMAAPYHPNEQKNFFENIRKGIVNLEEHQTTVPPEVCRTLLLRLSATASLPDCVEWTEWYLREYPDSEVELILLYQAVPAVLDLARNVTGITHCFVHVPGLRYHAWRSGGPRRHFAMQTLIGTILPKPTRMVMTDGKGTQMPFDGHYLYQRGDIYRHYSAPSGLLNAELSSLSPGVLIHADIEGMVGLQMIASPNTELLLLP